MTPEELAAFHEKTSAALNGLIQSFEREHEAMKKLTAALIELNLQTQNLLYTLEHGE